MYVSEISSIYFIWFKYPNFSTLNIQFLPHKLHRIWPTLPLGIAICIHLQSRKFLTITRITVSICLILVTSWHPYHVLKSLVQNIQCSKTVRYAEVIRNATALCTNTSECARFLTFGFCRFHYHKVCMSLVTGLQFLPLICWAFPQYFGLC